MHVLCCRNTPSDDEYAEGWQKVEEGEDGGVCECWGSRGGLEGNEGT